MVRCNFLFQQFAKISPVICFAIASSLCVPLSHAQQFSSVSVPEDKHAEGTVSVRDLSIPPRAYEQFQRGLQALQKQDVPRSIHYFSDAIKKYPKYYEAFYHLGVAQKRLGQDDQAAASFQNAIDLSGGKYALASYAYALIQCKQGKPLDAERTVRYALELDQNRPIGEVVLGTVFLYQHKTDEAEKSAREALSLDADTPDAYLLLAGVHGEREDYVAEVQDLDVFLSLEPQNSNRVPAARGIREVAAGLALRAAAKETPDSPRP
jgi:Tfp pilus assembly protein PilF